ncbi:efflux transporter outer membrane subunit [Rhodopseudomonas boonkerdii]|nr:efflux transporter outer membrane subunit [Rhodopseudomonas boonkerdii]
MSRVLIRETRNVRRMPHGRTVLTIVLTTFLSGCAVGPDFKTPEAPHATSFLPNHDKDLPRGDTVQGRKLLSGQSLPPEWWELFGSPALDRLVREGLAHNPDLLSAEASVRAAQANAMAQRGALFPVIDASFDGSRQRPPGFLSDGETGESTRISPYNVTTRQVSVSFVPDIWGGSRRLIEAADAETEVQIFQREGVYLTLASNIALAAIEEARLRGQIAATHRIIDLQLQFLRILRRQNEEGQIALPDVVVQESAVAQARLTLPPLQKQLAQQRNLLARLTGRTPADLEAAAFVLKSFRLPRSLPISLPGELVRQRPDVRTAEATLRGANAQIGAALAARLPQVTLSGNVGKTRSNMPDLSPGGAFWLLAGNVGQKVFDAGTLYFHQRAAEETTAKAISDYRSTVLTAFQNVADVLRALQSDAASVQAATAAEQTARRNIELIRRQVEQGQISVPTLIVAQEAYLQASLALIDARASNLADTVALFQALGGGWWNRKDS